MPQTMLTWIGVFVGLALFCLAQGAFWLLRARHRRHQDRMGRRLRGSSGAAGDEGRIRIRSGSRAALAGAIPRLRTLLEQAGVEGSLGTVLGRGAALALTVGVIGGALVGSGIAGLALALFAGLALIVLLARRRRRRLLSLEEQLPRALELMVFSLRAGHGLEESIRAAAADVEAPLSSELARCYQETVMGRPVEAALQQALGRWREVRALGLFVEAVIVLKRSGGNLVEVLERIVGSVRDRAAYRARHRALTSEGRSSGAILMALPLLSVGLQAVVAPDQLGQLLRTPTGRTVVLVAASLWVLGGLWISRLGRPTS